MEIEVINANSVHELNMALKQISKQVKSVNVTVNPMHNKFYNGEICDQWNEYIAVIIYETQPTKIERGTMMTCISLHQRSTHLTIGKDYRVIKVDNEIKRFTIKKDNGDNRNYEFNNKQFEIKQS